jgi:hypothetical protein
MHDPNLRDKLLQLEPVPPDREAKFREALHTMFEKQLNPIQKIAWMLSGVLAIGLGAFFGYMALTAPAEFPAMGRAVFAGGAVFGLVWAGLSVWILRRGSMKFQHENVFQGLTFGFVLVLLIVFMMMGSQMKDPARGALMVLNAIAFFLVFGLPALFIMRMNRTEATLREHLLRLELRLEELEDQGQDKAKD